jgi:hypothetical protein
LSSFSFDDEELALPYTMPLATLKAACPYEHFAFTRESAMNVGSATISATTDISEGLAGGKRELLVRKCIPYGSLDQHIFLPAPLICNISLPSSQRQ